jgi:hypothetical protein
VYLWAHSCVFLAKMVALLVEEELRHCTRCNRDLPLSMFPKGPRRFLCKAHLREMVKAAAPALSADERAVRKIWVSSYKDVKALRGDTSAIRLTHGDIKVILERAGQPPTSYKDVFVLPAVPSKPLTASNAVLAGPSTRRYLLMIWRRLHDTEAYVKAISTLSAEPLL